MLENIANFKPLSTKIPFSNEDTRVFNKVKKAFAVFDLEVVATHTFSFKWCYALVSDGSLWLLDKSHGGGGVYQQENHYRAFNELRSTAKGLEFWKAFYKLNFANATEDEVLEYLVALEAQPESCSRREFIVKRRLCEAFLEFYI